MLALTIRLDGNDWVHIIMPNGDRIRITANRNTGNPNRTTLIFDAPKEYKILREKLDTEYYREEKHDN